MSEPKVQENQPDPFTPPPPPRGTRGPKHGAQRPISPPHKRLKIDTAAKCLRVLQDAINDVRTAVTTEQVQIAATRCKAVAFAVSVWSGAYDKHVLYQKFLEQQRQLETLLARMQSPAGNLPGRH